MFTRLDALLFAAFLVSGAMALENYRRLDLSPDDTPKVTLAPVVCQPVALSAKPVPSAIDVALKPPFSSTMIDFAIECHPA